MAGPTLAQAAVELAERGYKLFPCHPGTKRPAIRHGHLKAVCDPARTARWWAENPNHNIGMPTGQVNGLVVLDVDGEDGFDSLRALEREHGELPPAWSVTTPSGGQHFYFAWPGYPVPCSVGTIAPGIDVRGDGGYVLTPPSVVKGVRYVVDAELPLAPMPEWQHQAPADPAEPISGPEWVRLLADGVRSARDPALTQLCGSLLIRRVPVELTGLILHAVNETYMQPPKPRRVVDKVLDSIAEREVERRRAR